MRSPSSTLLHPLDASWSYLKNAFQIDDPDAVRAFLADHPELPALLLEIREASRGYFGDDPMALEIFIDPEWEEAKPELFAVVKSRRGGQEALARLHTFDREWWLPKRSAARAPVTVTYDIIRRE